MKLTIASKMMSVSHESNAARLKKLFVEKYESKAYEEAESLILEAIQLKSEFCRKMSEKTAPGGRVARIPRNYSDAVQGVFRRDNSKIHVESDN